MAYVEYLRVRGVLAWHAGVLVLLTLFVISAGHNSSVSFNGRAAVTTGMAISLATLAPIAMLFAAIFASTVGASLNRENVTRDLSWTKPIGRSLLAFQYVAVDVAGIAIAFFMAVLAILAVLMRIGATPVIDAAVVPEFALALGVAVMWYALIQILTFWFPSGARAVGGILWPVALVSLGVAQIPGIYGAGARMFDIVNPLAYMWGFGRSDGQGESLWQLPVEARALVVWCFAAAFCAFAIAVWPRKEA